MSKIPKIIHQIWIGEKEMPDHCKQFTKEMQEMHPDWEYHLWGNEIFTDIYKDDKYLQNYIKNPKLFKYAYISDRIRLLLLRDFGGVYVDVDAKPLKSFNTILSKCSKNITFFGGVKRTDCNEKNWIFDCTVYGSAPNSRAINICLDTYKDINWANGGFMFSEVLMDHLDDDILSLGYEYFYSTKPNSKAVVLHDVVDTRLWTWYDKQFDHWFKQNAKIHEVKSKHKL